MSEVQRLIVVLEEPKRNPYEVWVLAALFISGLMFLIGLSPTPRSVQAALPSFALLLWNIQLVSGTAAALVGLFWRHPTTGRSIQIAGHLWTGTGAFIYACVLFYYNGLAATLAGLLVGGITIAAVSKSLQLRRQLNQMLQKAREHDGSRTISDLNGGESTTPTK